MTSNGKSRVTGALGVVVFLAATMESSIFAASLTEGNLLVTSDDVLYEYTTSGVLVQSIEVPYGDSRPATENVRDIVVDEQGTVQIFNGTFDPLLSSYQPESEQFDDHTHVGWSTVNAVFYGGIAALENFVFVTNMSTAGAAEAGIVRFDTTDFSSISVEPQGSDEPGDVYVGRDGLLYALMNDEQTVEVYDPRSLEFLRTLQLGQDVRGIAVAADGSIYGASWDGSIYHFDADGLLLATLVTGVSFLTDIDLAADGVSLVAGSWFGDVVLADTTLTSADSFLAGPDFTFVAWVETSPTVGGAVRGLLVDRVLCENVRTGERAVAAVDGAGRWTCTEAGLAVDSGDPIRVLIRGAAE